MRSTGVDFRDTADTAEFRQAVRAWIDDEIGEDERVGRFGGEEERTRAWATTVRVRKKLAALGWSVPAWPREYGGMGLSHRQQAVLNEELAYYRVPGPDFIAVNYVGPTLMLYGTDEQKARYLPPIVAGDEVWCQGYSEP